MSHAMITGGSYGERQGKGMPRTATGRGRAAGPQRTERYSSSGTRSAADKTAQGNASQEVSGIHYDISAGYRRVSALMAEQGLYPDMAGTNAPEGETANASAGGSMAAAGQGAAGETAAADAATAAAEETTAAKAAEEKKEGFYYDESSVEYMERLLESMKEARRKNAKSKSNKVQKKLNYHYRRVSGSILRAKTLSQAGNALASANSSLSGLRRKSASGKYNSKEIEVAVQHAKRMVRTARKKLRHLKRELQEQQMDVFVENDKKQDNKLERMIERPKSVSEDAKREQELMLLQKELKQVRSLKKNAHRRDESNELLQADLEYLKRRIQLMKQEQQQQSQQESQSGSSLSSDSSAIAVSTQGGVVATQAATTTADAAQVAGVAAQTPPPATMNTVV